MTSLASDPQMPDRMGFVTTQSGADHVGVVHRVQPEGQREQEPLEIVGRLRTGLLGAGGAPKTSAFTGACSAGLGLGRRLLGPVEGRPCRP